MWKVNAVTFCLGRYWEADTLPLSYARFDADVGKRMKDANGLCQLILAGARSGWDLGSDGGTANRFMSTANQIYGVGRASRPKEN